MSTTIDKHVNRMFTEQAMQSVAADIRHVRETTDEIEALVKQSNYSEAKAFAVILNMKAGTLMAHLSSLEKLTVSKLDTQPHDQQD